MALMKLSLSGGEKRGSGSSQVFQAEDRATDQSPEDNDPQAVGSDALGARGGSSRKATPREATSASLVAQASVRKPTKIPRHVAIARAIIDNKISIAFTTLLTVYALLGDDIRLISTSKPADAWFDAIVISCMCIFTIEIILSCVGKEDYFLGFFFCLDILSTATLILDISVVSDELADEGSEASDARASRSARIGAKMGRVVRVIRLVRIMKLYKAYIDTRREKRKEEEKRKGGMEEEDDWDDVDLEERREQGGERESRVGKMLSERTTRIVILLVLMMLMVLPLLRMESIEQIAFSANYGADHVFQKYEDYLKADTDSARRVYERELLKYLFYHNWFAKDKEFCPVEDCASLYDSHVFWFGMMGMDEQTVFGKAANASISKPVLDAFTAEVAGQRNRYNYGKMPSQAQDLLTSSWNVRCTRKDGKRELIGYGVSLLIDSISGSVTEGQTARCPDDLRIMEKRFYFPQMVTNGQLDNYYLVFYFDLRPYVQKDAAYNIGLTAFICVVLCIASLLFSNLANRLVLQPVEKMVHRVEAIRDDPLQALKMADEEFEREEILKSKARKAAKKEQFMKFVQDPFGCFSKSTQEPMETVILEKTIIKLGSLLALGFGVAGTRIIGQNMKSAAATAGVNAMIAGQEVDCITGVVRIRDFSIATEVLQRKIMTFVNQVAEIVHGVTTEYQGAPNKNNGDTFLIIWRADEEITKDGEVDRSDPKQQELLKPLLCHKSELSIVAFAKILAGVHRSPVLAAYRHHPGLQQRMRYMGKTTARVTVSFGLHCGWAIEGAVGSEFKIDASYLSPNVSIANSIEQATAIYNVPLLVAESVVQNCTEKMASKCRLIDKVVITGSKDAMELFSVDLDYMALEVDNSEKPEEIRGGWSAKKRHKARNFLDKEKNHLKDPKVDKVELFDKDPDIITMRQRYTVEFLQNYNMGYQNYSEGEWSVARRMLSEALHLLGRSRKARVPGEAQETEKDGPSIALLRFMESHGYEAPNQWNGVRPLTF